MKSDLLEEFYAHVRESMARELFHKINKIERPDIVIAEITKALDAAYRQGR